MRIFFTTLIGLAFLAAISSIVLGNRALYLYELQTAKYIEVMKLSYSLLERSKSHLPMDLQREAEQLLLLLPSPTGQKQFQQGMILYPGESAGIAIEFLPSKSETVHPYDQETGEFEPPLK